ncbi:DEAD/DEAH box helicase family protein [Rhodococcus fascians]|nr:DEAD/DEAH box helicase family protein [Rhodococcus fascians]
MLSRAVTYDRAVGYFTAAALYRIAVGIDSIASRHGRIRLIASPQLEAADVEEIRFGYDRRRALQDAILRELSDERNPKLLDGLSVIGSLIAQGLLDIKIAFVDSKSGLGIYHEKIAAARDGYGDLIAFTGSANETIGGLITNFESIEVYSGWVAGDGERALRIESDFARLWNDETDGLTVEAFPEVAIDRLIQISRERGVTGLDGFIEVEPEDADERGTKLRTPLGLEPRDYQREAVLSWLRQNGRGILKMATGTGKTKTALFAATRIADVEAKRGNSLLVVIVAPLIALVDQWAADVTSFGIRPVRVYDASYRWLPMVEHELNAAVLGEPRTVVLVTTNQSFFGSRFSQILDRVSVPFLIIADEVHNLGSETYSAGLPGSAVYRLGLSATPERWLDDVGTDNLTKYFGEVAYELGLDRAINELGVLCRYTYHPRIVELTHAENQLYAELTAKIAHAIVSGESIERARNDSPLGMLLRKRSAVLGHAEGKIDALRHELRHHDQDYFQLVYCAEGSRPAEDTCEDEDDARQLEVVMKLVGTEQHMHAHPYTSKTPPKVREQTLQRFRTGDDLQVLVAMRCLDEGVDIPDARIGYLLASSSNPRQFIQRRGRLLRNAPGKDMAKIVDFIAVPPSSSEPNLAIERKLLARELTRVSEFAKISENYGETLEIMRPIKMKYGLMDL